MDSRLRMLAPMLLLCAGLALGPAQAVALGPVLAAPDLVYGVVVSLEPRVVPDSGVIVTDVRVVEDRPGGGAALTVFTMRGGEIGTVGMWSEQSTNLSVGDSVVVRVAEKDGGVAAVAPPMVAGEAAASDPGLLVDSLAAGYAQNGIRWSDAALPVGYYVNQSGLPAGGATAITAAAQTWEDDAGSHMDFSYKGITTGRQPGESDGYCVVGPGSVSNQGAIAECSIWYNPATLRITEFDIAYNTGSYTFATDGRQGAFDVQGIGLHELGHTLHLLDLKDPDNANQVMYGYGHPGDTSQRVLKWGDIAGVRAIYPVTVPANAAPVAAADSYTAAEDTVLTVASPGVIGNDTDADGDALTASRIAGVSHGTLALAANGSFVYTPAAGFSGTDSFTYRVHDGAAYSNTVTVSINVFAANHAPIASDDVATVGESSAIYVDVPGVLGNDVEAGGLSLTASLTIDAAHGMLQLLANGAYAYAPDTGWSGTDGFSYRAFNGVAYSEPARVTITVTPDDAPPLTTSDVVTRYADAATITLTAADASDVSSTDWVLTGAESRSGTGATVGVTTLGSYTLEFRSADTAGNVEPWRTVKFAVIATPPSDGTASTPWTIPTLGHGKAFTVTGYVSKHTTGSYPISLRFYRYKSGAWVYYKSTYAKASAMLTFSKYSDSTSVPYAGKWRVRARSRYMVGPRYLYGGFRYFTAS